MIYSKKQTGLVFILVMLIILAATGLLLYFVSGNEFYKHYPFTLILVFCIIAILLFFQLKVSVSENALIIIYGIGLIRFKRNIDKLQNVEVIKVPWYYGMLIRITSEGMLIQMQGRKAVRINYIKDGIERTFMLGTPEPEKLKEVLENNFKD